MTEQTKSAARIAWRVGLLGCLAFAGLNAIIHAHARSFLTFASEGPQTGPPEHLGAVARAKVAFTGVSLPRPRNIRTPADVGLPFETASVQASDGMRLEAWWVPTDGPPRGRALLFHGYGGSKDELLEIAAWWHERDWAVGLVDFRGAGGSAGRQTTLGWEESLDVLALHAEATQRGEEPIVLYGFSMGAAAIAGAVGRHGLRPDGVVLEGCFGTMAGTVRNRFALLGLPATPLAELLVFWGGVAAGFDGFALRPVDDVRDSLVPMLVLQGADDRRAPPADGSQLATSAGSSAELVVLPRTGHQPGLSSRPPEWGRAVGRLAGRAVAGREPRNRTPQDRASTRP